MNGDDTDPERFPKIESPYHRGETGAGDYVIEGAPMGPDNYARSEFGWVFDRADEVDCIEKLDGSSMALRIGEHEHGGLSVTDVSTRMGSRSMNPVDPFGPRTNHHYVARAVQNSVRRGYTDWCAQSFGLGWFYGEAIGPRFQGNPHDMDEHLFVPFDWLRDKCRYRSYGEHPTDFESIKDWFRGGENGLFSLFASRMHGQDLESSRPDHGTFVEGVVMVHPDHDGRIHPDDLTIRPDGRGVNELAKLRRDMWKQHAEDEWPMSDHGHN